MPVINANVEIQKMLCDANLLTSKDIDGKIGPKTREAIDKFLASKKINSESWSNARKLVAAEQLLYQSQNISVGEIDGLVGQQTIHAREVYQANLTLTWRDRYDNINETKNPVKPSPTVFTPIDRSQFFDELKDINVVRAFAGRMASEVGSQGKEAQVAWAETTYNRAAARKKTLLQTVTGSYFPTSDPGTSDNKTFQSIIREVAEKGTNTTNGATGNASGMVGFGQGKAVKKDDGSIWAPGQTAEFGGAGGSTAGTGAGADVTELTESAQALYAAAKWKRTKDYDDTVLKSAASTADVSENINNTKNLLVDNDFKTYEISQLVKWEKMLNKNDTKENINSMKEPL